MDRPKAGGPFANRESALDRPGTVLGPPRDRPAIFVRVPGAHGGLISESLGPTAAASPVQRFAYASGTAKWKRPLNGAFMYGCSAVNGPAVHAGTALQTAPTTVRACPLLAEEHAEPDAGSCADARRCAL